MTLKVVRIRGIFLGIALLAFSLGVCAQEGGQHADTSALSLTDCIKYAFKNQPTLNQAYIDEAIAKTNKNIALSSWLPQVNGFATYQNYIHLPTNFLRLNNTLTPVASGLYNYSVPSVNASQTLYSNEVLMAARASKLYILGSRQNTANRKIAVVSGVSKAFYDLLLSLEQIAVYKEDTARLRKNQSDAYNRFVSGIVDKVDYRQATIALNNSQARLKRASEDVQAKYAVLKELMGFPSEKTFSVKFDTTQMLQEIYVDTLAKLQFEKRIEYQQLQTVRRIMKETTNYYRMGFMPSLSASYSYFQQFQANTFEDLYKKAYPYSWWGLQLNVPIFTGFRRTQNLHRAKLQEERIDWDETDLKLGIYSEYKQALANYKSNLYYLGAQRENVAMAREVYNVVKLQYREGVKPYLDVIIAESDLQTSQINYLNALFQLLASKIDLERAMGDIPTDI